MSTVNYLRVAAVTPKLHLGNPEANVREMLLLIAKLNADKVHVAVFPELGLTGYTCQDLFFQKTLRQAAEDGLKKLLCETRNTQTVLIVGMPLEVDSRLYNVAVVIQGGKILGVTSKTFLPNYCEFYEGRWFATSKETVSKLINLFGHTVIFGPLIFKETKRPVAWGIEICEDLWAVTPPSNNLALHGAQVIFNLSASNELVGKATYRKDLVRQQSGRLMSAYVYTSSGPGESASDTVFSGHAIIAENDRIVVENTRFSFENQIITRDIAIDEIIAERIKNTSFTESLPTNTVSTVSYDVDEEFLPQIEELIKDPALLLKDINPNPFVPSDPAARASVCEEIIQIQSTALQRKLMAVGPKTKVILGVSGGLDSTQALLVAVDAMDKLGRSRKDIIGITMPGLGTSNRTKNNAWELMRGLGVDAREISIAASVLQHFKDIGHKEDVYDITYENAQARERGQILADIGNQDGGIVLGTGDLSEQALGFLTFYGADSMSHLHVNSGVPKTLIKYLIAYFATTPRFVSVAPTLADIYNTPVSPELLPLSKTGGIAQETEKFIGPYELHDFILYWMIRKHVNAPTLFLYLIKAWGHKYAKTELLHWLRSFITRFMQNQFKRNSAPDGVKVGSVSLSERADWRMPSDISSTSWLGVLDDLSKL